MQVAIKTINEMVAAVGKPKWDWKPNAASAELDAAVAAQAQAALSEAYRITVKQERYAKVAEIKAAVTAALAAGQGQRGGSLDLGHLGVPRLLLGDQVSIGQRLLRVRSDGGVELGARGVRLRARR